MIKKIFPFFLIFCLANFSSRSESQAVSRVAAATAGQRENPTDGLTLMDCYRLALRQSESVAIQQEALQAEKGRFLQALSGVLPRATYSVSERRQDGRSGSNFTLEKVPENKFVFSQPLFSGFREFAAIAASRSEKREQIHAIQLAKQLLFTDVVEAFYLLLSYQGDLETIDEIRQALTERIEELRKRGELGRSRRSEIVNAQARLSRVDAERELVLSEAEVSRQLLEFLTGTSVPSVRETETGFEPLGPEENYLAKVDQRPDVLAAKESLDIAQKQITIARAAFWPSAEIDGNYYTKRVGNSEGVDWDATWQVDVPLFAGGENWGKLKEARSLARQEELKFKEVQRNAALNIRNAYTIFQSATRREEATQKMVLAMQENYQLQQEDYRTNLVNNLDVLQALEDWHTAQRDLISVQRTVKQSYWNLQAAIGEIPDDSR